MQACVHPQVQLHRQCSCPLQRSRVCTVRSKACYRLTLPLQSVLHPASNDKRIQDVLLAWFCAKVPQVSRQIERPPFSVYWRWHRRCRESRENDSWLVVTTTKTTFQSTARALRQSFAVTRLTPRGTVRRAWMPFTRSRTRMVVLSANS